jgi:hypothetical protein
MVLIFVAVLGLLDLCVGVPDFRGDVLSHNSTWAAMCPHRSLCCNVWRKQLRASDRAYQNFMAFNETLRFHKVSMFDPFEPTWNCETKERVPETGGDGPKWMCGIDELIDRPLVYSFGSLGDVSFELGVRAFRPNAEIVIFDPTLSKEGKQRVESDGFRLVESGLVGRGQTRFDYKGRKYPAKDLIAHMADLGHSSRTIDVLKVDIENSEYTSLSSIKVGECPNVDVRVGQLQIEMHSFRKEQNIRGLFENLNSCGLRAFSKERNQWCVFFFSFDMRTC